MWASFHSVSLFCAAGFRPNGIPLLIVFEATSVGPRRLCFHSLCISGRVAFELRVTMTALAGCGDDIKFCICPGSRCLVPRLLKNLQDHNPSKENHIQ